MDYEVDTIVSIGNDEFYRAARYQVPLSVIFINSSDKDIFAIIESNLRATDLIQQITSDLIIIFLSHTNEEGAKIFAENIKKSTAFTYVVGEYKGFKVEFIKNLFIQNEQMKKEA